MNPWDSVFPYLLMGSLSHWITAAAIIVSGLVWYFSEHQSEVRKLAAVAFGGAMALAAMTLLTALFPAGPIPPGAMP